MLALARSLHQRSVQDGAQDLRQQAEQAYRHVLRSLPDEPGALTGLGLLRSAQGDGEEAISLLRRAVANDPANAEACNNLGSVLLAWGRPQDAFVALDEAVRLAPHIAEAHNNRARASAALGRHREAEAGYRAALAIDPTLATAAHNLARTLAALDDWAGAAAQFERTVALDPARAVVQAGLARAYAALGRHEEARAGFERALAAAPEDAELHNDAGATLAALDAHPESAEHFRAACRIKPAFAAAHSNLGNALMAMERPAEAVASYRAALAIEPDMAEAHGNMGVALMGLHHPEDALPHLNRALDANPSLAGVLNSRGHALVLTGDLEAARDSFARATALRPEMAEYYPGLVLTQQLAPDDPRLAALEAMSRDADRMDGPGRIALHFALHRVYEDQGAFQAGFVHLLQGNALRRARMPYDEARALGLMRDIAEVFGPAMLRGRPPRGSVPDVPIFVLGMPRSGSTLVEQILSSHRDVFGGGERMFLADAARSLGDAVGGRAPYPANAAGCAGEAFLAMGNRYRRCLQALAPGMPRVTDKMPANFHHVGLIRMALPDARVIHTRRDPVDTCLSCFALMFKGLPYTNELGELGRYHRAYVGLMDHWRDTLAEPFVLDVDYEAMVSDTEAQVRRILDFCGLDWDPACLDFHTNTRTVLTASATQVRQPIYQRSAGRSRRFGALLDPLKEALAS